MRTPLIRLILVVAMLAPVPGWALGKKKVEVAEGKQTCPTSREFITTLEYLRSKEELKLPEPEARKLAISVTGGCAGAANRFIQVTELLIRSGLTGKDAAERGLKFADQGDSHVETFRRVFQIAFLREYLDLDLRAALSIAEQASLEFGGDPLAIRRDFEKILEFCGGKKGLNLPKPQCGAFAARIAKLGAPWNAGISGSFIDAFEFLRSQSGPGLTEAQALQIAERVAAAGPDAGKHFVRNYKYAVSEPGLKLPRDEAVAFARDLTTSGSKAQAEGDARGGTAGGQVRKQGG